MLYNLFPTMLILPSNFCKEKALPLRLDRSRGFLLVANENLEYFVLDMLRTQAVLACKDTKRTILPSF